MKKIIVCLLCLMFSCTSVSALVFPEPDWGALLNEKKAMVSETDFELYAEGTPGNAPFYGAKLEPKSGVYFGAVAEHSDVFQNVGAYMTYFDVNGGQPDIYWPANEIIRGCDDIVVVALNVSDLSSLDYNVVRNQLNTLATYNKPMIIRFANEMNVSSIGDNPEAYIAAFRSVADMIHEYENFAVVWSPNDMGGLDRPFSYYYPGDAYVDWVGVSSYQKKYFLGEMNTSDTDAVYFMTGKYAFATNALKPIIRFMEENNIQKPVMISEGGVSVKNKYGENLQSFAEPRLRDMYWNVIMKYPQVKLINYFNVERPGESQEYYISNDAYAVNILNEASTSGAYIGSFNASPEFTFTPAPYSGILSAKDGAVKLYTLAHFPGSENVSVNYRIDGKWYHSSDKIPYKLTLNLSNLSDGDHTIEISALDRSKTYNFFKTSNYITFLSEQPDGIKIIVNGSVLSPDVPPVIIDGRTMVPLRVIFEALGADVKWDDSTKTVTATRGDTVVSLTVEIPEISVNGVKTALDVPGQIVDGRTLIPVRAVSESFGCSVAWSSIGKIVSVDE